MPVIWIESEAPVALHVAAGGGCADTRMPRGPWRTPAEYTGQVERAAPSLTLPRDEYHASPLTLEQASAVFRGMSKGSGTEHVPLTLAQVAATTMRAMPSATNDEATMLVAELRGLALRSDLALQSLGLTS